MSDQETTVVDGVTARGEAYFAWMLSHPDADAKAGLTAFEAGWDSQAERIAALEAALLQVQEAAALLDFEANLGDPTRAPALREIVRRLTVALEGAM